jgi:hypothetical protein
MSILRVKPSDVETFGVVLRPRRSFIATDFDAVSGTYSDVTGSMNVYAVRSPTVKDVIKPRSLSVRSTSEGGHADVDGKLRAAHYAAVTSGSNYSELLGLLHGMSAVDVSARLETSIDVLRIQPGQLLDRDMLTKRHIREVLFPYYRPTSPSCNWAYSNYNTLNFFTGSSDVATVPTNSVVMYPNTRPGAGVVDNVYLPQGPFTFDFRINPRYTTRSDVETWRNGTILHMSGVYALSLLTGSDRDDNGRPTSFRVALQVLSGTFTSPSSVVSESNSIWISDDMLKFNRWHRVVVRWGTNTFNDGSGSFVIDGVNAGTFVIPSASLATDIGSSPDVLYVGNFYEGPDSGSNLQTRFFSTTAAVRDGVRELQSDPTSGDIDAPMHPTFSHPLSAEIHELRIWNEHISDVTLNVTAHTSPTDMSRLLFYVPPFFTATSPVRTVVDGQGGVLQTPFDAIDGTSDDPFNVALSFGVSALYVNLENFSRDWANDNWPRLFNLSASLAGQSIDLKTAVDTLYSTASVAKRNLTILPCDDGQFTPNYSLMASGGMQVVPDRSTVAGHYVDDLGVYDASLISLTDLVPTSSYISSITADDNVFFDAVVGPTADNPGVTSATALTVLQRTRDASSNEVTVFDVSNAFYDRRITPGSVVLSDGAVTGSAGRVTITLRDNGIGGLYRADALTEHARWAHVGNVLYDEGLIVVKTPNIPYFGREGFELSFKGEHVVHTYKLRVTAAAGSHTSSSNPTYIPVSASLDPTDMDPSFVYITGINIHDDNMNIVMKTTLAQPIVKRSGECIVFKIGMDF